ncbi:hypothetical protein [Thermophilibacter sp.]
MLPGELSCFDLGHPLPVSCFSRDSRSQSTLVRSYALLAELPPDSFLEVTRIDGRPWGDPRTVTARLYVEAPALSLLRMTQQLARAVEHGHLSEEAAFSRLLSFPMEACGSYARDPSNPALGDCAYELDPIANEDEIRSYLDELSGVRGVRAAREAARWAKNGSGSPGETLISLVMRLPPRRGGIPLPHFVENEPIAWPDEARDLIRHQTMRPDFHWPHHRTASEYNGGLHGSPGAYVEDSRRDQDYGACDIQLVTATYEDICTVGAIERYVTLVARKLAPYEGPGFLRRVGDNIRDPRARQERAVLLAQLLPPDPRHMP